MFFKASLISVVAASAVVVNGARLPIDQRYSAVPEAALDARPLPKTPSNPPRCGFDNFMVYGVKEIECSRWATLENKPRAFAGDTVGCKWAERTRSNAIGSCFTGV